MLRPRRATAGWTLIGALASTTMVVTLAREARESHVLPHKATGRIVGTVEVSSALSPRRPVFRIYSDPGSGSLPPAPPRDPIAAELRNVVVYLEGDSSQLPSPVGATDARRHASIAQRDERFVPHVVAIVEGGTVDFPNEDDVYHNVYSLSPNTGPNGFDLGRYPRGASRSSTFPKAGTALVFCHIHGDMSAIVLVLPNPFFASPGDDHRIVIDDVPEGDYTIVAWHEKIKRITRRIHVTAGQTTSLDFNIPLPQGGVALTVAIAPITSARARVRRLPLGIKIAVLGAAVTAAVIAGAFWALGIQIRAGTRDVLAAQLANNQRTLQQLQQRKADQLLFAASLAAQAPSFQYSLKEYQLETNGGQPPNAALVREIQEQLRRLSGSVGADLILVTDDSGRVFATAGPRAVSVARGTSVASLAAVRHVLDPKARADTGELGVLKLGDAYLEVAAYPLVQNGYTLGALLVGERLDSAFVASARAASDASVVLIAGTTIVASDRAIASRATAAILQTHARDATPGTAQIGDQEYVVAPVSLGETQDHESVRLWMLQPLSLRVAALTHPLARKFVLYGVVAVLVAAVGAGLVSRRVLGPFHKFVRYMRSGAATEHRQAAFNAEHEASEVRILNASFNQLMDSLAARRRDLEQRTGELASANVVLTDEINERIRIEHALRESEAQLRQSQKLEAIGTLAGGIAHDFNNLITVISGYTQLALMRADKTSAAADDLRQVIEASDRAANLTHQLLAFSRKQVLQPTVLDLDDVVNGIAPMLHRLIGEQIELNIESGTPLARVRADRGQLEQVLLNLAVNARDAMLSDGRRGGTLTIATRNEVALGDLMPSDGDAASVAHSVSLVVTDTGSGMSAETKERIFEPFFTTKELGKGTGLGLSTVYGIVNQSGGTIAVDTELNRGTSFIVSLPAAESFGATDSVYVDERELPTGHETILIVEDAEDVRTLARRTLEERGYSVLVARNAAEAMEISAAGHIDLLLTDIVMPEKSGPQLVAEYLAARPAPLVIYMSGYSDDALERFELDATAVFLRKPFSPAILSHIVRDVLDGTYGRSGERKKGAANVDHAAD